MFRQYSVVCLADTRCPGAAPPPALPRRSIERSGCVSSPTLMRFSTAWKATSSDWRKFWVRTKVRSPSRAQHGAWKAKRIEPDSRSEVMGGSCRKSPQSTTWIPPKGTPSFLVTLDSPSDALSRNSPDIIEISSMTRAFTLRRRLSARDMPSKSEAVLPRPQPRNECRVPPPTWQAAAPVDAHTASSPSSRRSRRRSMSLQSVKDFPVPGRPVKNTLSPRYTEDRTCRCSSDSCGGRPGTGAGAGGHAAASGFLRATVSLRQSSVPLAWNCEDMVPRSSSRHRRISPRSLSEPSAASWASNQWRTGCSTPDTTCST
mmetsp:Transcript_74023/g.208967  ORF Transcript_74023/g.208967 Transcript_74023/m.208967 type:complete len:316 (+) Transcript_74023:434-1381(+)